MSISLTARKLLWARAANQCAFPDCMQPLTEDLHDAASATLRSQGVIVGEEAHIRSGRVDGPRFESNFPSGDVDSYENLVLLCPTHHTLIDKNKGMAFTVEQLLDIKRTHESAMALSRSAPEALRQKIEERTVATVDTWSYSQYLTDFDRLTFGLNTAVPGISEKNFGSITETAQLLLSKVWPTSYPQLGQAFEWHRMVLTVLTNHIRDSMEGDARAEGRQRRTPRRDKRLERWDPVEHQRLFREFLVDCTVTWYLTTHLVKSANLVVRAVHSELDPLFRFEEGLYLMHTQEALSHRVIRLEYPVNYSPSGAVTGSLEDIRARVRALAGETSSKRADDIILEDIDGF